MKLKVAKTKVVARCMNRLNQASRALSVTSWKRGTAAVHRAVFGRDGHSGRGRGRHRIYRGDHGIEHRRIAAKRHKRPSPASRNQIQPRITRITRIEKKRTNPSLIRVHPCNPWSENLPKNARFSPIALQKPLCFCAFLRPLCFRGLAAMLRPAQYIAWVAQATRLCRRATRPTDWRDASPTIGRLLPFRSASRRAGRAGRPLHPR